MKEFFFADDCDDEDDDDDNGGAIDWPEKSASSDHESDGQRQRQSTRLNYIMSECTTKCEVKR